MYEPHLTENEQRQIELEIQWSAMLTAREHRREIRIELGPGYQCDCQVCHAVWETIKAMQGDSMQGDSMEDTNVERVLHHQSGVNATGEPFVQLVLDDKIIAQMTSAQAREHAQHMLEAAEASEQDAFLLRFAQDRLQLSVPAAANLLLQVRRQRAATGKSQGPISLREWTMGASESSQ